jgi:HEAT repeat protein
MHIPRALGKLGDPRAIPLLINMIEEPIVVENDDSDSSDDCFTSGGSTRLVIESRSALATFLRM